MKTYNSVKPSLELKRKYVLEELLNKGVTTSQLGVPIENLDYEELKYELVLSTFRDIDIKSDSQRWF